MVVDSRSAERGEAIRRRRECVSCGRRFTTYERVEQLGLVVVKRDGTTEPYDRENMVAGIRKAPVKGPEVTSQQVGLEVLSSLQKLDQVAYVRFASVYKDFQEIGDFERELGLLLQKRRPKPVRADHNI
jgi:transcriptional repressor NrdR